MIACVLPSLPNIVSYACGGNRLITKTYISSWNKQIKKFSSDSSSYLPKSHGCRFSQILASCVLVMWGETTAEYKQCCRVGAWSGHINHYLSHFSLGFRSMSDISGADMRRRKASSLFRSCFDFLAGWPELFDLNFPYGKKQPPTDPISMV
jgi:hypothetical protein